ncbi:hypothetical protein [Actinoplanes sp. G11-F43]|uniref:hypothetical protein n=1 Tax=Actinoplanes sp. G11-F43 TaxID=3424130 RepID=UPI003D3383BA
MNTEKVLLDGVTILPAVPPVQRTTSMPAAETLILPDGALQLLALAQRTADDHLDAVNRHVHQLRAEAQAAAELVQREARVYAAETRAEADRTVAGARAEADRIVAAARVEADRTVTDARAEAERIVTDGKDHADQLTLQAQQRYQDAVGGLALQREALQRQIEALSSFDNDYRQRITAFLQNQLRALWAEQPGVVNPLDLD